MRPGISPWAFVLAVPDLNKSAAYFRDVLGFKIGWGTRRTGDSPSATACG